MILNIWNILLTGFCFLLAGGIILGVVAFITGAVYLKDWERMEADSKHDR
jgi:hypothetical protein